jgi:hypothetical protein
MGRTPRTKTSAIVPPSLFRTVIVTASVVPAVLQGCLSPDGPPGCGSTVASMGFLTDSGVDAREDASDAGRPSDAVGRDATPEASDAHPDAAPRDAADADAAP